MQAARISGDDRHNAEARAATAATLIPGLKQDVAVIQELCETDPRVLGRGRKAVAGILSEAEAIATSFEDLSREFQEVAHVMRARGHCTTSDLACVCATVDGVERLALAASRLRLRLEGPRLRVVRP